MSYQPINLTTIQLPAPSSNMTKAEYKAAYGIDLDNVDIHKFTLVVLGKEKYAIDKIKAVEDGYEIFFAGKVLSITDIVQTSDDVYDVENAKPIYYHPITIWANTGTTTGVISFVIIDNSPTAYTKDTILTVIDNLNRIVPLTGGIKNGSVEIILSYAYKSGSEHIMYGVIKDTFAPVSTLEQVKLEDFISQASITFNDDVNKIN